jgi:hypothetical protein
VKEVRVPDIEMFNEQTGEFITIKGQTLKLEHSLVSISKWESRWHKPFMKQGDKTREESVDYIRCMTLNKDVDDRIYQYLPNSVMNEIRTYIDDPMTATTFQDNRPEGKHKGKKDKPITSELIYYWMIALNIPPEYQKWHLNRLLTLIKICNLENNPKKKKMSKRSTMSNNMAINAARRQAMNSKG